MPRPLTVQLLALLIVTFSLRPRNGGSAVPIGYVADSQPFRFADPLGSLQPFTLSKIEEYLLLNARSNLL